MIVFTLLGKSNYILIIFSSYFSFMQIAQVHRATLLNGQEVVVKVQHQGVKTIILEVIVALAFRMIGIKVVVKLAFTYIFGMHCTGLKECKINS